MPTLNRRADGAYYVRHFHHDHSTWQIRGKGVRFLERRGVSEDDKFATDLFMKLFMKGWVYHGLRAPLEAGFCMHDRPLEKELASCVSTYHATLHRQQFDEAARFLINPDWSPAMRLNFRRSPWKVEDLVVYDFSSRREDLHGATHLGAVYIMISNDNGIRTEHQEYWLRIDGRWRTYGVSQDA